MSERATAVRTALKPKKEQTVEIKRPDPFALFNEIYDEIANRAFAIFQGNGGCGQELEHWVQAEAQLLHPVHVRMSEADNSVTVDAEVPGFAAGDLAVGLEGRRLTITGKREQKEEQKKGKAIYHEQCSNEILRVIELPADVNAEKATATLRNGVVEIEMPKSAEGKAKRVAVKIA